VDLLEKFKKYEQFPKDKIRCMICFRPFKSVLEFIAHHQEKHTRSTINFCIVCCAVFRKPEQFMGHTLLHNESETAVILSLQEALMPKKKKPTCKKCNISFDNTAKYTNHYLNFHKSHFKCHECGKEFTKNEEWKNHRRRHKPRPSKSQAKIRRTCDHCNFVCKTYKQLTCHLETHHKNILDKYNCDQCNKVFNKKSALKTHMKHTHNTKGQNHLCDQCGKSFKHKITLTQHSYRHLAEAGKRKMECAVCNKYVTVATFVHHMSKHITQTPYSCPVCNIGITLKANLERHMLSHKGDSYTCGICTLVLYSKAELNTHKTTHMNEKDTFTCPICEEIIRSFQGMAAHCRTIHKKNDLIEHFKISQLIECKECKMKFDSQAELEMHNLEVQSHVEIQSVDNDLLKCNFCDHLAFDVPSYVTHRKTHEESYTLKCKMCIQRFRTVRSLKAHELGHSNIRPFECSQCPMSFTCKEYLRNHVVSKHLESNEPKKCQYCVLTFTTNRNLKKHEEKHAVNLVFEIFKCDKCSRTFKQKKRFEAHLKTHIIPNPFHCEGCGHTFRLLKDKLRHEDTCNVLTRELSRGNNSSSAQDSIRVLIDSLYD
jgi:KRAB domain-containing zinc finger protein